MSAQITASARCISQHCSPLPGVGALSLEFPEYLTSLDSKFAHLSVPENWAPLGYNGGEGNGTPLQYSCMENRMDGGAWWAAVHGVAKSRTRLSHFTFTFSLSCIGEGNGNPLQCSCLENPRDGGSWWADVYGVTQSRT